MKTTLLVTAVAIAATAGGSAVAAPITGQFSITGNNVSDSGSTLSFQPNTVSVGSGNTLSGSFATLLTSGETGSITSPITYSPTYAPGSSQVVLGGGAGTTVTFLINSLTEVTAGAFGNFTGAGTISTTAAGFNATPGTLLFTTQGNGTVTFSATTTANPVAVPEPMSFAVLGTGLLGLGLVRRWKV